MVNDQITEVDGTSLAGITNQQAVEVLKHTGSLVQLTIVRYLRGLKFEELQDGIKAANVPTPTSLDYMTSSFLSELGGGNHEAKVVPHAVLATEVELMTSPLLPVRKKNSALFSRKKESIFIILISQWARNFKKV